MSVEIALIFSLMLVLSLLGWVSPVVCLIAGIGYAMMRTPGDAFRERAHHLSQLMLKVSVIGLGFGLSLGTALQVGRETALLSGGFILFTLSLGWFVNRRMRLENNTALLIAVGTAICGGSAIAAVAPTLKANSRQVAFAVGVVFALNGLALVLFPPLGHWLGFTQHQFGIWAALAIHDTSSVVGAASQYGSEALNIAATTKLVRALWIIPVALIAGRLNRTEGTPPIPVFLIGFLIACLLRTFLPGGAAVWSGLRMLAQATLGATLTLIGLSIDRHVLRAAGWKPLAFGIALWMAAMVMSAVWVA
ncbi:putative sulfate exporter family transporter [bacterium]|nr:putative sulfate exporter family transporter [bacterium]